MKAYLSAAWRDARVVIISVVASVLAVGGAGVGLASVAARTPQVAAAPAATAPAKGTVFTGEYAVFGDTDTSGYMGQFVALPAKMQYAIDYSRQQIINAGASYTTECPAPGKVGVNGWVCIYEASGQHGSGGVYAANGGNGATSKKGFALYWSQSGSSYSNGTWAVRVGGEGTAPDPNAPIRNSRTVPGPH